MSADVEFEKLCTSVRAGDAKKAKLVYRGSTNVNQQMAGWDQRTPLQFTLAAMDADMARFLLQDCGANPNLVDDHGRSALHLAVLSNDLGLVRVIMECSLVDYRAVDTAGKTVLHLVADGGNRDMATLLIEKCKECVSVKDAEQQVPLDIAYTKGDQDMVQLLLNAAGSLKYTKQGELTPLSSQNKRRSSLQLASDALNRTQQTCRKGGAPTPLTLQRSTVLKTTRPSFASDSTSRSKVHSTESLASATWKALAIGGHEESHANKQFPELPDDSPRIPDFSWPNAAAVAAAPESSGETAAPAAIAVPIVSKAHTIDNDFSARPISNPEGRDCVQRYYDVAGEEFISPPCDFDAPLTPHSTITTSASYFPDSVEKHTTVRISHSPRNESCELHGAFDKFLKKFEAMIEQCSAECLEFRKTIRATDPRVSSATKTKFNERLKLGEEDILTHEQHLHEFHDAESVHAIQVELDEILKDHPRNSVVSELITLIKQLQTRMKSCRWPSDTLQFSQLNDAVGILHVIIRMRAQSQLMASDRLRMDVGEKAAELSQKMNAMNLTWGGMIDPGHISTIRQILQEATKQSQNLIAICVEADKDVQIYEKLRQMVGSFRKANDKIRNDLHSRYRLFDEDKTVLECLWQEQEQPLNEYLEELHSKEKDLKHRREDNINTKREISNRFEQLLEQELSAQRQGNAIKLEQLRVEAESSHAKSVKRQLAIWKQKRFDKLATLSSNYSEMVDTHQRFCVIFESLAQEAIRELNEHGGKIQDSFKFASGVFTYDEHVSLP